VITRNMLMLIALITSSTCSIICGTACDLILPGECLSVGHVWGPCEPDTDSPAGCTAGLTCLEGPEGHMCVPLFDGTPLDAAIAECAAWRGPVVACSEVVGLCAISCIDNPDGCIGGTVCDDRHRICVYPPDDTPSGETTGTATGCEQQTTTDATTGDISECYAESEPFGPCTADNDCDPGLACIFAAEGNICSPGCGDALPGDHCGGFCGDQLPAVCHPDGQTCAHPCTLDDDDCPDGQVCDDGQGICVFPKPVPRFQPIVCGGPGGLFGSCDDNVCDDGLMCFTAKTGHMCTILNSEINGRNEKSVHICGDEHGTMDCDEQIGFCRIICNDNSDCPVGNVCDLDTESCVFPWEQGPGENLGPCIDPGNTCLALDDTCRVSSEGTICAHTSGWGLWACNLDEACLPGQVCADDLGYCVWPS
jgi:hypothetical protein